MISQCCTCMTFRFFTWWITCKRFSRFSNFSTMMYCHNIHSSHFKLIVLTLVLVEPPLVTEVRTLTDLLETGIAVTFTRTFFRIISYHPFSVGNSILKWAFIFNIIILCYQDSDYQLCIRLCGIALPSNTAFIFILKTRNKYLKIDQSNSSSSSALT